ncbi:hypothetical protein [Palleronia caenipelagi]|uniref:DUF3019 domain-containing protein n=1 Tax=Palleronia caenipelagi TaxID=2489174 RepID=A0A547QAP3_9RHOB|nr:hypothetical protein [Palleronia caenipelagi]TRD23439.1 hypothetical protein FEV53_00010 [Palleronia caenipelagi]
MNIKLLSVVLAGAAVAGAAYFLAPEASSSEADLPECIVAPLAYANALEACEPYSCRFKHPFDGKSHVRSVIGREGDLCLTWQSMPNDGTETCRLDDETRQVLVEGTRFSVEIYALSKERGEPLESRTSLSDDGAKYIFTIGD